jgi:lipoate---protein ligase
MALSSCTRNTAAGGVELEQELAADLAMFQAVEGGSAENLGRCWQVGGPVVVAGRHSLIACDVAQEACRADGVPVIRRFSGGGTIVLGHGCLNYAVALSLVSRPELTDVAASFRFVLEAIIAALEVPALSIAGGTDLVVDGRKVSGNAQRRGRRAILHHGTLLYDFDARLATRYLKEPIRQPAYRGARRHADFLGNIALGGDIIRARLDAAWMGLPGRAVSGCL